MDFRIESGLVNFILIVFLSISIIEVLDFLIKKDYSSLINNNQTYQSSIWCSGDNVDNRKCRAVNLCYQSNYRSWIFLNGPDSIESGLPENPFGPGLISISSLTGHNQFYLNYVVIDSQYFHQFSSKLEVRFVKDSTLIFGRFKPDNLMHLLHDDILPVKWTLNGLGWSKQLVNFFLHDDWPHPKEIPGNYDLYKKLFNLNQLFTKSMDPNKLICFQEAHIGLDRETIWYQYGFKVPQGAVPITENQKVNIGKLTNQLRSILKPNECPKGGNGVFLSRTFNRLILNEDELIRSLSKNIKPVIKMNVNDNLVQLIERIYCSNLLIGIHGSSLALSLFLPPGSSIVEIFPFGINPDHYTPYKTLSSIRDLNYISWVNHNLTNSIQHPEYSSSLGGINSLPDEIKSSIKDLNEQLEPHLCCYDPNWLYRIYQDTIVDINQFNQLIVPKLRSHSEQSQSRRSPFYPGPVINIDCVYGEPFEFKLTWKKPWNIEFTDNQLINKLNYEILIDEGEGRGHSYIVTIESLSIPFNGKESFPLWIRCILNERKGPFMIANCSK
ncbi:protein O-linked-mannose beta-1,4-N-acetylglucosaminyltransferase 2-like [Panonychus citri]|uniref:protein O-linked-mannose beta-1,4-N-acetylglucosaminyltransferase 2-like n=1 Tax=Panonychus citri TaxID=50023 RepID=UPI0023074EE6|nr:protein O-linked-mannose beta-1,4-N-acetylglucosaminyltransferase 2-like [Panonychus citri]